PAVPIDRRQRCHIGHLLFPARSRFGRRDRRCNARLGCRGIFLGEPLGLCPFAGFLTPSDTLRLRRGSVCLCQSHGLRLLLSFFGLPDPLCLGGCLLLGKLLGCGGSLRLRQPLGLGLLLGFLGLPDPLCFGGCLLLGEFLGRGGSLRLSQPLGLGLLLSF